MEGSTNKAFKYGYVEIGFQIYFYSGATKNKWVHSFVETHALASAHSKFKQDQTFHFEIEVFSCCRRPKELQLIVFPPSASFFYRRLKIIAPAGNC